LVFLQETHPLAKAVEQKVILILKNKGVKDGELNEAMMKISSPKKDSGLLIILLADETTIVLLA
jgi:hypothetical protein